MSIHVHLTDDDYIRFNQFYATRTKRGKRFLLPLRVLPFFMFALLLLQWTGEEHEWSFYVAYLILVLPIGILWVMFVPALFRWLIGRRIPREKKTGKLPYTADSEITWDNDSFTETTEHSTNRVRISEIEHFYLTPAYVFVFINTQQAYIIPRSLSQPEVDAFIAFLKARVPCEEWN